MITKTYDDNNGGLGVPIGIFCFVTGLSYGYVRLLCENGLIYRATLHPKTGRWWIYAPFTIYK